MDSSTSQLHISKIENPLQFDFFHHEDPFEKISEFPPMDTLFEFNNYYNSFPFQHQNKYYNQFKDFGDTSGDMFFSDNTLPSLYEDMVVDVKPLNTVVDSFGQFGNTTAHYSEVPTMIQGQFSSSSMNDYEEERKVICSKKKRSVELEMEEIQKYFDVPITKAAKEMKVGLTVLKKRCRELNIMRWPHRKIKSLKSLINNVKELGLTNEIMMLEDHRRLLEQLPDMELSERTKKLRQACFKANYKKRRALAIQA